MGSSELQLNSISDSQNWLNIHKPFWKLERGLAKTINVNYIVMKLSFRDMQLNQMSELHELLYSIIKHHIKKSIYIIIF